MSKKKTKKNKALKVSKKQKAEQPIKEMELPRFFNLKVEGIPNILHLLEIGFDRKTFNRQAWLNLIKFIQINPDINVVFIDGAISRLDRPEYLCEELTHWLLDQEEAEELTELTPSHEQFTKMAKIQRDILKRHLLELRKACPNVKILWSSHSDGLQYSFTYRANEALVGEAASLLLEVEAINGKIGRRQQVCREAKHKKKELAAELKNAENYQQKRSATNKIATQDKKIARAEAEIESLRPQAEELTKKAKLFRPAKITPIHQVFTRELTEAIYENLDKLAKEIGITHIPGPAIIKVNDMVIDYSHSRHFTWGVIKRNDQNLLNAFIAQGTDYRNKVMKITGGYPTDIVLQSHHGTGWSHVQRMVYDPDSLNFNDIACFDSSVTEEYLLHFVVPPTFEDQTIIEDCLNSRCPTQMGPSGKPMNSRNHASIERYRNGGISGLMILTKNEFGIGKQTISYNKFKTGSILDQPDEYHAFVIASDEHICHPIEDPISRLGFLTLIERYAKEAFNYRGKPAHISGCLHLGDIGEPNRSRWPYRPEHKLNAFQALAKAIELEATTTTDKLTKIFEITRLIMSGLYDNMEDVYSAIADYMMGHLNALLSFSDLKYLLGAVPGNHIGSISDKDGIKEFHYFAQRLKAKGIDYFETGRSGESVDNTNPNVRVALGGYENAYSLFINKYGLDKNGKPLFGPLKVFMIHNPSGSGKKGTTGSAVNSNADLTLAGHTHEQYTKAVRTVANKFRFTLRAPTLQKVTPIEIKYASGPARTSGACMVIMPSPEDVMEFHLDAVNLRKLGRERAAQMLAEAETEAK